VNLEITLHAGVVKSGGAYANPVTRLSFHRAQQKFLGLVRGNPPVQQKLPDDDVDMLVPDGELMVYFWMVFVPVFCYAENLLRMLHDV